MKKGVNRRHGAKTTNPYKYAKKLAFLKKHFESKGIAKPNSFASVARIDADCTNDEMPDEDVDEMNNSFAVENFAENEAQNVIQNEVISDAENDVADLVVVQNAVGNAVANVAENVRGNIIQHQQSRNAWENASEKLLDYLIQKDNKIQEEQHPVDAFLAGISPTMKTLSPYLLHLAKSEIFAVVQKFEFNMMSDSFTIANYHPSYTTTSTTLYSRPLPSPDEINVVEESKCDP